jgi:hypothetical protein
MRGLQITAKSNGSVAAGCIALICAGMFFAGCKGSEEMKRAEGHEPDLKEFIGKYEKTFNPAEYNPDITLLMEQEKKQFAALHPATVVTLAVPETIPGFRVQVLLTQEIDQANALRDSITGLFPEELVYVVYDAPYYKIRMGNYTNRQSANPIIRKLNGLGFKESWVVPDNVLKDPPLKLPEEFIEPQRTPYHHN